MENMWVGVSGLVIAFGIIVTLLLYIFIHRLKISFFIKMLTIPICLWYSIALYNALPTLMGWPVKGEPPVGSIIYSYHILHPKKDHNGLISLWVFEPKVKRNNTIIMKINPKDIFSIYDVRKLRSYSLEFNEKRKKELIRKSEETKKKGGFLRWGKKKKRKKDSGGDQESGDDVEFDILHLNQIVQKDEG